MKKKSSNPVGMIAVLSFCSLIVILSYLMRTISIPSTYGAVDVDIPVMAMPLEDGAKDTESTFAAKPEPLSEPMSEPAAPAQPKQTGLTGQAGPVSDLEVSLTLGDHSPMVFLTDDKAFFGRLTAFTRKLSATHNKFAFDTKADRDYRQFAKTFGLWLSKLPHISGPRPSIAELNQGLAGSSQGAVKQSKPKVVIILPAQNVAMDKVIHMIAALKSRPEVDRVVLGGGLL